jgi:protein-disulfide isomerase
VKASRDPAQPPAWGPNPAKVYVLEFCDYRNATCARMVPGMKQIAQEWPGDVRMEFHFKPAPGDTPGENAAVAALAAHQQGKFWPMHECLFANQDTLASGEAFETCARQAGLDLKRFAKDRESPKLRARVQADAAAAERLGARHAPAYTINGRLYLGWRDWELLQGGVAEERRQVDAILAKKVSLQAVQKTRTTENLPKFPEAAAAYAALSPQLKTGMSTKTTKR